MRLFCLHCFFFSAENALYLYFSQDNLAKTIEKCAIVCYTYKVNYNIVESCTLSSLTIYYGLAVSRQKYSLRFSDLEISMNFTENLITLTQAQETSLFPFPFSTHIIFSCIAVAFLIFQFTREKKPYQIIISVAVALSLAIWLSDNRTLFYAIGIAEALLLIAAFVTAVVFKHKELEEGSADAAQSEENSDEKAQETPETAEEAQEETAAENSESDAETTDGE